VLFEELCDVEFAGARPTWKVGPAASSRLFLPAADTHFPKSFSDNRLFRLAKGGAVANQIETEIGRIDKWKMRGSIQPFFIPSRRSVRALEAAKAAMSRLLSRAKNWADTIVKVEAGDSASS
jgi:hypothetical protein